LRPQHAQRAAEAPEAPEAPETRVSGQETLEIQAVFENDQKYALRLAYCGSIGGLFRPSLAAQPQMY